MSKVKAMPKILILFGTRPEAIKLAPVIQALSQPGFGLEIVVGVTGQHAELLDEVLETFAIQPDFNLRIMRRNQQLAYVTTATLAAVSKRLAILRPDMVMVQGDTTTAFASALAAYYQRIPIAHVEAGLRTGDKYRPFPEESNRCFIDRISDLLFAPTERNRQMLLTEGLPEDAIFVTGNTIIDALTAIVRDERPLNGAVPEIWSNKLVLLTMHRRENIGKPLQQVLSGVRDLAGCYKQVQFIYPVHPNPNVRGPAEEILRGLRNVDLIAPVRYSTFVRLLQHAYLVITDSGGLQEEAPTFRVPVLVARDQTERQELIEAGGGRLVGTDRACVFHAVSELLEDETTYQRMRECRNPFGDGTASVQIAEIIQRYFQAQHGTARN